jgi:hypothetical protein
VEMIHGRAHGRCPGLEAIGPWLWLPRKHRRGHPAAWPTKLNAMSTGCLKGSGASTGFYYYQVLVIR